MKTLAMAALLLGAVPALGACTDDGRAPDADAPAPASAASTPDEPDGFDRSSYTYTLRVNCFCPDGGVPITVTVRDGEVVDAVYARRSPDHAAGDPAAKWQRLSIEDIVDAADDARAEGAAEVKVRWPDGQDHPTSVWIDQDRAMADEEIGYTISNVRS